MVVALPEHHWIFRIRGRITENRGAMPRTEASDSRVVRLPIAGIFSQLNVRLPAELGRELRAFSSRSGRSLSAIVIEALEQYLDQQSFRRSG